MCCSLAFTTTYQKNDFTEIISDSIIFDVIDEIAYEEIHSILGPLVFIEYISSITEELVDAVIQMATEGKWCMLRLLLLFNLIISCDDTEEILRALGDITTPKYNGEGVELPADDSPPPGSQGIAINW